MTFDSVFNQTFQDFEFIVIDGGSTDGSKELIEKNSERIIHWVSEADKGVYNAMNKGIEKTSGEYLVFVNSGDSFINIETLANAVSKIDSVCKIIYFNLNYIFSLRKRIEND